MNTNWTKKLLGVSMALGIALSISACGTTSPEVTESTGQTTVTTAPTIKTDKTDKKEQDSKKSEKKPASQSSGKKDDQSGKKGDSKDNQPKESTPKETQPKEEKAPTENKEDLASEPSSHAPTNPEATDPAHTHHYIAVTTPPSCITEGYTKYTCDCGDSWVGDHTEMLGHTYGDWVTTKEPTTEAEGQQTRTCSRCGGTETRSIDKLPTPEPGVTAADIPALEAYARSYAEAAGFTIDTSLNLSNAGYYPSWGYNYTSLEHAKSVICEGIESTKSDLIASHGTIEGCRYNCIIEINSDGEFVDYHLYG